MSKTANNLDTIFIHIHMYHAYGMWLLPRGAASFQGGGGASAPLPRPPKWNPEL